MSVRVQVQLQQQKATTAVETLRGALRASELANLSSRIAHAEAAPAPAALAAPVAAQAAAAIARSGQPDSRPHVIATATVV